MIHLMELMITKIDSLICSVGALLPVLRSEYITEQLMLANLNNHWVSIFIVAAIAGIILLAIGYTLRSKAKSGRRYGNYLSESSAAPFVVLGYIILVISIIALPILHAEASHKIINAATPLISILQDIIL